MQVIDELKNSEHQHALRSTREANEQTSGRPLSTNTSSSDTLGQDLQRQREDVRSNNPRGLSRPASGVDVLWAESVFAELSRELSGFSRQSPRVSRRLSFGQNRRSVTREADVEKTVSAEDSGAELWDLEEVLHGSKAAEYEAGIKSKRIGRIFDHAPPSPVLSIAAA